MKKLMTALAVMGLFGLSACEYGAADEGIVGEEEPYEVEELYEEEGLYE